MTFHIIQLITFKFTSCVVEIIGPQSHSISFQYLLSYPETEIHCALNVINANPKQIFMMQVYLMFLSESNAMKLSCEQKINK